MYKEWSTYVPGISVRTKGLAAILMGNCKDIANIFLNFQNGGSALPYTYHHYHLKEKQRKLLFITNNRNEINF